MIVGEREREREKHRERVSKRSEREMRVANGKFFPLRGRKEQKKTARFMHA